MKHIDLDYHFVPELVTSGKLYTKFVPTNLQLADFFTKSLLKPLFEHFRSQLCVCPLICLRGEGVLTITTKYQRYLDDLFLVRIPCNFGNYPISLYCTICTIDISNKCNFIYFCGEFYQIL